MKNKINWRHIPLLLTTAFAIAPLFLLFSTAVKTNEDFSVNPLGIPSSFQFSNFIDAWNIGNYSQAFINSIIVALCCIVIIGISASLAAYALSKMEFKGSSFIMGALLFTMSIPMGLFLVPLFFVFQNIGLMNSLSGVILIYSAIFMPFNIFMFRSFFVKVPDELLDSARLDGCSEFQLISKIIFPLTRPAFLTSVLLVFLWTWNEFFFANAFLQSNDVKTVATRYLAFTGDFSSDWTLISAAGVITIIPVLVLFLILQRQFIEGLTEGSIK